jgi:hypothetical protein
LREEPCLHLLRDFQLLGSATFGFQPLGDGAALRFDFPTHFVEAQKRKGVSVHIFEPSEHSVPSRGLRRMMKANPALTPLLKRGIYIFGEESNLTGPANELEFFRIGLRSDKHENRAIRAQPLPSGHRIRNRHQRSG